jgi:hypothetical protein
MRDLRDTLKTELRRRGILSAHDLTAALRVSQPTVSRLISGLGSQCVLRIGGGRSTRYALRRSIGNLGETWPLYQILADGNATLVGRLHALEAGQWYLEQQDPWTTLRGTEFSDGLYPGLPWFLRDLRPQGFLGRCFARWHGADLHAPPDPRLWSDDHVLAALVRFGDDLPGAFVAGEGMLASMQRRRLRSPGGIDSTSCEAGYPALAEAMLAGEWPGSSAAGEQPKFTADVIAPDGRSKAVIVKFSGQAGRPEDDRWADLLVAEHEANRILSEHGIPCAATRVLRNEGRTFLESTRFDREGLSGRRGLVSLEALDAAFFGRIDTPWTAAAERLGNDGWITAADAERLSLLWWFGMLIGNTDMHYGNISLYLAPHRPLRLAPVYDMTPMHYRPTIEGRLADDTLELSAPPPEARLLFTRAARMALRYWGKLAATPALSAPFRMLADRNGAAVARRL